MSKCAFPHCRQLAEVGYGKKWLCTKHLAKPTAVLHERVLKKKEPGCLCSHCQEEKR